MLILFECDCRMDVARYKLCNPSEFSGCLNFYISDQKRDSMLNGEADADSLDVKLRSGGRYWSSKYSALERHTDFKRMRIVGTAEMPEFSEFIPLGENSDDGSQEKSMLLEESWEDEVLRRAKEFNKLFRESPHDEKVWIAFAEFQDKVARKQPQKGARLLILEKKISILEKAIELNPDNKDLLLSPMKAYQKRDSNEVLTKRWEKVLMQHSGSYMLWREFLHVLQEDFSRFKVSNMRKMYGHAIQALSSACAKQCRSGYYPTGAWRVDIFVSLCRLEWHSGYQELATGLFQAEIEYSLSCPSLLLTEQSKQRLFEHFWDENGARLGEDGALGWSIWLEKEEEKRQQIIKDEETLRENEEGCWTGWSEPQSDDFEKDFEAEANMQDDDFESLLKKLGIDAETDADSDVKDTSTWSKWSKEELIRDREQWMPSRHAPIADSILDDLRCVRQVVTKLQSSSSSSALECLLGCLDDEVKRTNVMKFLRNAILLCLNVFPRNYLLEEAALVAEELFTTKMNLCPLSVTPSRTLAKVLLKNDRQDLLLCGLYARREAAYGNIDLARKVFDTRYPLLKDFRWKPSVIACLFALSYELDEEGSRHRIHALFERALANDKLEHSVILWRCYIAYELDVVCNPSAAKRVFFRAIHACSWSKKLWLDGFLKLNSILTAKELSDLQEVMRDKEIYLRTDIYEILLQDETDA
ncbi:hypothetical protein MKX01_029269 [Papaver californicum]|nr:hypothetical protein MKX01_029269 [Papaver californicum]